MALNQAKPTKIASSQNLTHIDTGGILRTDMNQLINALNEMAYEELHPAVVHIHDYYFKSVFTPNWKEQDKQAKLYVCKGKGRCFNRLKSIRI
jgi:hypothetical protein